MPNTDNLFVGREEELKTLLGAMNEISNDVGLVCLVTGEPGAGKTALVHECLNRFASSQTTVLLSKCVDGIAPPYWPWKALIEFLARHVDIERFAETAQIRIEYLIGTFPGVDVNGNLKQSIRSDVTEILEDSQRFYLYQSVYELLRFAAESGPIVLVIEDLHWADSSTCGLLDFIAREIERLPILFLGTYRNTDVDRKAPFAEIIGGIATSHHTIQIRLPGLEFQDVVAMIAHQNYVKTKRDSLARDILERTDGNALFAVALIEAYVSVNEGADQTLPESIRHVIGRSLSRLSDAQLEIVRWAAVLGSEYRIDRLFRITENTELENIMAAIDAARNLNLLILIGGQSDIYRFRHEIIRETILNELPLSDRVRIHMRCATELERLRASGVAISPTELLHHFRQSKIVHGSDKVAEYAMEAADLALEQHDYDAVMELLDIGIDESSSVSSATAARLYAKKAHAYTYVNEGWLIDTRISKCHTLSIGNAIESEDLALLREVIDEMRWPFPISDELNELLEAAAGKLNDDHLRELTVMTRTLRSNERANEYSLDFARKAESWMDITLATRIRLIRAYDFHSAGLFQEQLDEIHAARSLHLHSSDELVQLIGMRAEIDALGRLLRHEEALRIAESLKPLCVRHPYSVEARSLLSQLSFLYLKQADWHAFDELVGDLESMRPRISYPAYRWYRITSLVDRDLMDEARSELSDAIESVRDAYNGWALSILPRYAIHADDTAYIDLMLEIADRRPFVDISKRWGATAVVARAIWAFYRAEVTVFEPELRQIDPALVDAGWELLGFLFDAIGDTAEAFRCYIRGLEEDRFHRPRVGWLLYRLTKLHWESDRSAAIEWLRKGRFHAREFRLTRVERLLTELEAEDENAPMANTARTQNSSGLTQREIDVLREVASGKTDAEIAETLFISTKTVSNHVGNILRKTGTANRTEAARFAVDRGVVEEHPD